MLEVITCTRATHAFVQRFCARVLQALWLSLALGSGVAQAQVSIDSLTQSPANPVLDGTLINYQVTISSDASNGDVPEIRMQDGGATVTALFDSPDCQRRNVEGDVSFVCPRVIAGEAMTFNFTWPANHSGASSAPEDHSLTFSARCDFCEIPSTANITTQIRPVNAGTLQFEQESYSVNEAAGTVTLGVSRIGGSDQAISVSYNTADGSASAGSDYTAVSGQLSWADGDTAVKTFTVSIGADSLQEGDETFSVTLDPQSVTAPATLGTPATASVTIVDDDTPIQVPATLNLTAAPGETANGSFNVDAVPPISVSADLGTVTPTSLDAAGEVSYSFAVPADAAPGSQLSDTITVTDGNSNSQTIAVTIDVPAAAVADDIVAVEGDGQTAEVGQTLAPFVVEVLDDVGEGNQPLAGATVNWTVSPASAGSLANGSTTTGTDGRTSNTLTVLEAGTITVTAAVAGTEPLVQVSFTVGAGGLSNTPGLSENERAVARAMDNACQALRSAERALTAGEQDLLATCDGLIGDSNAQIAAAMRAIAPEEIANQGTLAIEGAKAQWNNIDARMAALRGGETRTLTLSGLSLNAYGEQVPGALWDSLLDTTRGGGASGDGNNRLGFFINGSVSVGEKDSTRSESGMDFDTLGLTAGVDYRFNPQWIAGLALGYLQSDSDFATGGGGLDVDGISLSAYTTWQPNAQGYIDGILSYGWNDYDASRRIHFGSVDQTASGDTDGSELALSIGGGYDYIRDAWRFGPFGRINYIQLDIDGYSERASDPTAPGSGLMLAIGEQDLESLTAYLGGQVSYVINSSRGVFMPQLRLEWGHEFQDDSRFITARFLNDPTSGSFAWRTDNPDRDFFNLGLGVSATFAQGRSAFIYYETVLGRDDLTQHTVNAGARWEF